MRTLAERMCLPLVRCQTAATGSVHHAGASDARGRILCVRFGAQRVWGLATCPNASCSLLPTMREPLSGASIAASEDMWSILLATLRMISKMGRGRVPAIVFPALSLTQYHCNLRGTYVPLDWYTRTFHFRIDMVLALEVCWPR